MKDLEDGVSFCTHVLKNGRVCGGTQLDYYHCKTSDDGNSHPFAPPKPDVPEAVEPRSGSGHAARAGTGISAESIEARAVAFAKKHWPDDSKKRQAFISGAIFASDEIRWEGPRGVTEDQAELICDIVQEWMDKDGRGNLSAVRAGIWKVLNLVISCPTCGIARCACGECQQRAWPCVGKDGTCQAPYPVMEAR